MSSDARLILKRAAATERWEHSERGDYDLDRFDREFQERLYSQKGREILAAQRQNTPDSGREPKG
ncbi:MAG: hypothetical protein ACLQU1_13945 [Bryobacteraceae bacterium]